MERYHKNVYFEHTKKLKAYASLLKKTKTQKKWAIRKKDIKILPLP